MKKQSDVDWSILKGSIIMLCVSISVGISMVLGSYYFKSDLNKQYIKNNKKFKSISRRYLDVDQEEKLLNEYYPVFVDLYNSGVIGREQRLNWIEALRKTGESTKLPSLTYEISSQQEYKPSFQINYNGFSIYSSSMRLNLGLLHEGDLFKVLEDLDKNAEGIYSVTECKFRPSAKGITFSANTANITTTCLLQWLTINFPGGKNIELI